jgi:mRNA interferase RelE/StbE
VSYRVEVRPSALKQLASLPRAVLVRVDAAIQALGSDPRPVGVKKLSGQESVYRVRVGDYRVVYTIDDQAVLVLIVRVAHRRDVYR